MVTMIITSAIGLIVLAAGFWTIERLWPAIPHQPRFRGGMKTDVAYYFLNRLATRLAAGIFVFVIVLLLARLIGVPLDAEQLKNATTRDTWVTRQPLAVQIAMFIVLADFIGYWMHRHFHRRSLLWKYHAIHHSSKQMDWLASVRVHPVNDIVQNAAQAVPLLLLGFSPATLGGYIGVLGVFAVLLHSNVGWTFGPLRYVVASPVFHRWHHTTEKAGVDTNFAGLFPWMDALFGTLYFPKGVQPLDFGVLDEDIPEGFLAQLAYPVRRRAVA